MSPSELSRAPSHFLLRDLMLLSRVNAVETLYAAFPGLMYIDSTLGEPLLEPLFQLQDGSEVQFAASDLGVFRVSPKCLVSDI
jgi:hypothetical protein